MIGGYEIVWAKRKDNTVWKISVAIFCNLVSSNTEMQSNA